MYKQNVVYSYNKKEQNTDIFYNIHELQNHYARREMSGLNDYVLCDAIYMKYTEKALL